MKDIQFRHLERNDSAPLKSRMRCASSIRELERNACNDGHYRISKAVSRTTGRRSRSRRNRRFRPEDFKIVRRYIRKKWSPMQVASTLKKSQLISISHEIIYKHIWADKASGGKLYRHLRQSQKKRRKRYKSNDSREILPGKRHISQRSKTVERRKSVGHWEIALGQGIEGSALYSHPG